MRKILFLLLTTLFVACSQNTEKSLEEKATEQMKVTLKEVLNNPDGATLTGVRTVYQKDSIIIIDFTLKTQDNEGKTVSQSMEYIYVDMDKMKDDQLRGQLEGIYYIGMPGSIIYEVEYIGMKEQHKDFIDAGFDPTFVSSNTAFTVSDRYRDELIEFAHHSPTHPNIREKLIFSAAWLKIMISGREVVSETKEIKL